MNYYYNILIEGSHFIDVIKEEEEKNYNNNDNNNIFEKL